MMFLTFQNFSWHSFQLKPNSHMYDKNSPHHLHFLKDVLRFHFSFPYIKKLDMHILWYKRLYKARGVIDHYSSNIKID